MAKYFSPFLIIVLISILGLLSACDKLPEIPLTKTAEFEQTPDKHAVKPIIEESSGIADSKTNPGNLWVHEDSGRPTQLYLLNHDGNVVKPVYLAGAVNRDWEDMTRVGNELYIGDIGDNSKVYPEYTFYQFTEPALTEDTVRNVKAIRFQYPDGSHDAEAFLVNPETKDIYIITKQDNPSRIYQLTFPYNYNGVNSVTQVGNTPYTGIVSAALSEDGKEILLKTYTSLYHRTRQDKESIVEALKNNFTNIPYQLEPQGEALTFAVDNSGFFTLSEKGFTQTVNLYFYQRK
ncbi:hypothetical protein [Adhaeribacter radiodurans]|uniref:PE-PGRS family protein n=1 Tax=Adhaeribacter radiodurans TaxID=2745197 RepID=A0A7L7L689_9BACT|nr:hypothetical protein [Adhaeribacter radiodurans]QMU28293.1 hypothetical protein HUW48_09720 [Adhaeribacter radiodurans]